MKILRLILLILLLLIVVVAIGGFLIYTDTMRGPLPQTSGSLTVPGLQGQVEILRDNWGIPHIYGSSLHDLYFAQGYTQAQDRWWQMEFFRHTGRGAIEELTGKTDNLIETDIFIRMAGWWRTAEAEVPQLGEAERAILQAFADGINVYILNRPADDLAMEYRLLAVTGVNITIEPWTIADTIVWGKVMAWSLTDGREAEFIRQAMLETLGSDMERAFNPPFPFGSNRPTIVYPEDLPVGSTTPSDAASSKIPAHSTAAGFLPGGFAFDGGDPGIGSNNWVATGSMTASGTPLLANDPHLGIQMPSIWYEIGLHCLPLTDQCPLNVVGFALSPAPGIVVGHNDHIAWGVTNAEADVQDLYQIIINPDNPLQYQWNGEWRDMTVHEETINFGDGEPPLTIQVRETHFGPVINDNQFDEESGELLGFNRDNPLVMRWTGNDLGTLITALSALNLATNWDEFRDALRFWNVPSQNVVYADVRGNIGYQLPGSMPIRPAGVDGLSPSPAAADTDIWQGYIPFDSLPFIYNPAREFIVTANQAVVPLEFYDQLATQTGQDFNYQLGFDWAYGQRGQRITEMLHELAPHTVQTFQQIQGDNRNMDAPQIIPYLANLDLSDDAAQARDLLLTWDYQMHMSSPRAALFALFSARLLHNLFDDQMPEDHAATNRRLFPATQLLNQPDNEWWDDVNTPDVVEQRDDILIRSFEEAVTQGREQLGADLNIWQWGALHAATFVSNPLGASGIDMIEQLVNRGPVATNGGSDSVNATGWNPASGDFSVRSLPSMRMIVDLGNFENSVSIHTTGQSGHPASPHYGDMIDPWRTIQYHLMRWSRESVEAAAVDRLILIPAA